MSFSTATVVSDMNLKAVDIFREGNFERAVFILDQALGYLKSTSHRQDHDSFSGLSGGACSAAASAREGSDCSMMCDDSGRSSISDGSMEAFEEVAAAGGHQQPPKNPMVSLDLFPDLVGGGPTRPGMIRSVSSTSCPLKISQHRSADNVFEFYGRFLVFDKLRAGAHASHAAQLCLVLYNMGVCYQSEAIRLQQLRFLYPQVYGSYYQYALQLYNMAQLQLHDAWDELNCEDEGMTLLLGLALSNNSGHIHAAMGNFRESRFCLDAIQHFMQSTGLGSEDDEGDEEMQDEIGLSAQDQSFFTRTAIIFEDRNLQIAPSA